MSYRDKGPYAYCKSAGCGVSLAQTEGRCRDEHNCSDANCPLEKKFHGPDSALALNLLAPITLPWEK